MTMHAIIGSREYPDLDAVERFVSALPEGDVIVSGGARGVDTAAESAARRRGITVVSFRPVNLDISDAQLKPWRIKRYIFDGGTPDTFVLGGSYPSFGACAYARNTFIVDWSERVHAFWDGRSRGTKHGIEYARQCGKLDEIVRPDRAAREHVDGTHRD